VWNTILVSVGRNGGNAAQMTADPTAGLSQIVAGLNPGTLYQLTTWLSSARPVS